MQMEGQNGGRTWEQSKVCQSVEALPLGGCAVIVLQQEIFRNTLDRLSGLDSLVRRSGNSRASLTLPAPHVSGCVCLNEIESSGEPLPKL